MGDHFGASLFSVWTALFSIFISDKTKKELLIGDPRSQIQQIELKTNEKMKCVIHCIQVCFLDRISSMLI